jgi:hypothetical protein
MALGTAADARPPWIESALPAAAAAASVPFIWHESPEYLLTTHTCIIPKRDACQQFNYSKVEPTAGVTPGSALGSRAPSPEKFIRELGRFFGL